MINKLSKIVVDSYYKKIVSIIEEPIIIQEKMFDHLLSKGVHTLYGYDNKFNLIQKRSDFEEMVPIIDYSDLRPYLNKIIVERQQDVLWPTPVKWFAMSSGTTAGKSKYIPVTEDSLYNCHYRCGYHMLGIYGKNNPYSKFYFGNTLVLGGSKQSNLIGDGIFTADISAILMKNLPFFVKRMRTPEEIALIPDWEEKLQRLYEYAVKADIRAMAGVPSWMLILLKKIKSDSGRDIADIWPNLEVFFHGGVNFLPFQAQYDELIPASRMNYWETYNASEGFFGVQFSSASKDMLLLLDNEVYYEFIPMSEWTSERPKALPLSEVEIGKQYAIVITTSGGLWRYKIGDTVEFTSTKPYLFRITGRTKQFINAFGEELIVDNADKALYETCMSTGAKVTEYTVAPLFFNGHSNGSHQWVIEFEKLPVNLDKFIDELDANLKKMNSDYEAKRSHDLVLNKPLVKVAEQGLFYKWMKNYNRVGGQNKVPKLSNNREYMDSILEFIEGNC